MLTEKHASLCQGCYIRKTIIFNSRRRSKRAISLGVSSWGYPAFTVVSKAALTKAARTPALAAVVQVRPADPSSNSG